MTTLKPLIDSYDVPANSDYFPFLDTHAVKARFLQKSAKDIVHLTVGSVPILDFLDPSSSKLAPIHTLPLQTAPQRQPLLRQANAEQARQLAQALHGIEGSWPSVNTVGKAVIGHLRKHGETCAARPPLNPRQQLTMNDAIHTLGKMVNSYLSSQAARVLWTKLKQSLCPSQLGALPNQWLELMTQMALRNTQAIGEIAQRILDHLPQSLGSNERP